jgi:hypothetical protein
MALDKSKYDNVIQISEWVLCTLIADYHGVDVDDVNIELAIDTEGQPYIDYCEIGCNEPEREATYASHY